MGKKKKLTRWTDPDQWGVQTAKHVRTRHSGAANRVAMRMQHPSIRARDNRGSRPAPFTADEVCKALATVPKFRRPRRRYFA